MIKQLIINDKKSYDDFNVYIASRNISSPKKKTIKESPPFSNIVYDFSKINGELYWEERKLEYSFDIAEISTEEMEIAKSNLLNWLLNVHDTDIYDPYIGDYHFHGSYDSDSWSEDFGAGTISVSFTVYPYKISNSDTNVIEEIGVSDGLIEGNHSVVGLKVDGNSTQETRSGKNLFNKDLTQLYTNGVTVNKLDEGIRVNLVGTSIYRYGCFSIPNSSDLLGKTLTISTKVFASGSNDGGIRVYFLDNSGELSDLIKLIKCPNGYIKDTITIPTKFPEGATRICLLLYANYESTTSNEGDYVDYSYLQIEEGSTATSFELYGMMPSLSYPSSIKSVENDGSIKIISNKKNLFKFNDVSRFITGGATLTIIENGIRATQEIGNTYMWSVYTFPTVCGLLGKDFTLSFNTSVSGTNNAFIRVYWWDSDKFTYGDEIALISESGQTFHLDNSIPNGYDTIAFFFYSNYDSETSVSGDYVDYTFIQLELGNKATNYEEYQENINVITLNDALRSLPNGVCDSYENGIITRRIGEIVLNGSENWGLNAYTQSLGENVFELQLDDIKQLDRHYLLCDKFINTRWYEPNKKYGSIMGTGELVLIYLKDQTINTVEAFKTWLSNNPITVLYELETPIIENVEQPTITTYSPITNIIIDGGISTTFEVYYNDTKTITINNNSSHRIAPTITSTGSFTISMNGTSYAIGEGVYNGKFYLESGSNTLKLSGYGSITFSYKEELF